ncbi:hypothetical protein EVAR_61546_1 [Eumeta japonica]|uniref:Uncharacterized protein n=1 Tax=Eumeta variegata TaxID=151549 RepID=A0A4C1ZBL4_EUMVA|nr:hypothetical protein EVAR_61546_1 [Eumeta japonica]
MYSRELASARQVEPVNQALGTVIFSECTTRSLPATLQGEKINQALNTLSTAALAHMNISVELIPSSLISIDHDPDAGLALDSDLNSAFSSRLDLNSDFYQTISEKRGIHYLREAILAVLHHLPSPLGTTANPVVLKLLSLYNGCLEEWTVFVLYSWEQHERKKKETTTQRKRRLEKAKLKRQDKIANEIDVHKRQRLEK